MFAVLNLSYETNHCHLATIPLMLAVKYAVSLFKGQTVVYMHT